MKMEKQDKNASIKKGVWQQSIETAKRVCARPKVFFIERREEKSVKNAIRYVLTLGIPFAVLTTVMNAIIGGKESFASYGDAVPLVIILQIILVYVFLFLLFFIEAGLVHLVALALGSKARYKDTYRAIVYGDTPSLLAGWLPIIGLFTYAYSIYLHVIGIRSFHRFPTWRAALAVLIPVAIVLIVTGIALTRGNLSSYPQIMGGLP